MIDQYVKLFSIDWIEPWLIEALAMIGGAIILAIVVCKANEIIQKD